MERRRGKARMVIVLSIFHSLRSFKDMCLWFVGFVIPLFLCPFIIIYRKQIHAFKFVLFAQYSVLSICLLIFRRKFLFISQEKAHNLIFQELGYSADVADQLRYSVCLSSKIRLL